LHYSSHATRSLAGRGEQRAIAPRPVRAGGSPDIVIVIRGALLDQPLDLWIGIAASLFEGE